MTIAEIRTILANLDSRAVSAALASGESAAARAESLNLAYRSVLAIYTLAADCDRARDSDPNRQISAALSTAVASIVSAVSAL